MQVRDKKEKKQRAKDGIYWTPLGGNNIDQLSGNSHVYQGQVTDEAGKTTKSSVIIDLGRYDNYGALGDQYTAAAPDATAILHKKGDKPKANEPEAIMVTHGHADHILGITDYVKMGYELPPVHAGAFTLAMIKRSLAKQRVPLKDWPELKQIKSGDKIKLGGLTVEAIPTSHSVPDCFSFHVKNQSASVFHSGDIKIDQTNILGQHLDLKRLSEIGKDGVDMMVFDATTASVPGQAREEAEIGQAYDNLIKKYAGSQMVVAVGGSHLDRMAMIAKQAAKNGRKVIIDGDEYQKNHMQGLKEAGYDFAKAAGCELVKAGSDEHAKLAPEKTLVLTTGNYGDKKAPLNQAALGNHKGFSYAKNAVAIVATKVMHNEIFNNMEQAGVKVITSLDVPEIEGSGHAQLNDLKVVNDYIAPKQLVPTHTTNVLSEYFTQTAQENNLAEVPFVPKNHQTFHIKSGQPAAKVAEKQATWICVGHDKDKKGRFVGHKEKQVSTKGRGNWPRKVKPGKKNERKAKKDLLLKRMENYKQSLKRNSGLNPVHIKLMNNKRTK